MLGIATTRQVTVRIRAQSRRGVATVLRNFIASDLARLTRRINIPNEDRANSSERADDGMTATIAFTVDVSVGANEAVALGDDEGTRAESNCDYAHDAQRRLLLVSRRDATTRRSVIAATRRRLNFFFRNRHLSCFVSIINVRFKYELHRRYDYRYSYHGNGDRFLMIRRFIICLIDCCFSILLIISSDLYDPENCYVSSGAYYGFGGVE